MAITLQLNAPKSTLVVADQDAAAVEQALADPAAFAILYRRYSIDVFRYCYRRLNDRESSEDATSQVFTRALTGLPGLKCRPFRPWIFAIARNVVIDIYRGRHETSSLDELVEHVDSSPTPELIAIDHEGQATVRLFLRRLPERDRQVVELRLAGLTGLEIAQTLGCSHGAVRVAHHRAIERLRELMTGSGERDV